MAYIELQDLDLKIDFIAKDLTIVNFNNTMKKLETFVNALNSNNIAILSHTTYSVDPPATEEGSNGDTWIQLS